MPFHVTHYVTRMRAQSATLSHGLGNDPCLLRACVALRCVVLGTCQLRCAVIFNLLLYVMLYANGGVLCSSGVRDDVIHRSCSHQLRSPILFKASYQLLRGRCDGTREFSPFRGDAYNLISPWWDDERAAWADFHWFGNSAHDLHITARV